MAGIQSEYHGSALHRAARPAVSEICYFIVRSSTRFTDFELLDAGGADSIRAESCQGWIYLIKSLLAGGVAVKAFMMNDEYLHYVNRPGDLVAADDWRDIEFK